MNKVLVKSILLATLLVSHTPSVHARPWSTDDKCAISIVAAIGGIVTGYALYSWATDWYQTYKENKIPLHVSLQEAYNIFGSDIVKLAQKINWHTDTLTQFNQIEQLGLTRLNGYENSYEYKAVPVIELIKKKLETLTRRKESCIELITMRAELQSALSLINKLSELIGYHRRVQCAVEQTKRILCSQDEYRQEASFILQSAPYEKVTRITDIIVDSRLTHAAKAARNHSSPIYPFINYRQALLNLASRIQEAIHILENGDASVQNAYPLREFQLEINALQKVAALIELHPNYIAELNLKQQEDARRREEEHRQEMARVARRQMEQAAQHQREMERLALRQARATQELADAQRMQAAAQLAAALNPQPIVIEIQNNTHHRN